MKYKEYFGYIVFEDGTIISKMKHTPMSSHDNGRGYLITCLRLNGKSKVKAIHRIVAEAFVPNPLNLSDVDHIDGNRRNNYVSNLRWVSHGDNIKHSYNLKNRSALGENNANCKSEEKIVIHICELLQAGKMPAEIRDMFHYKYNLIRGIKQRKNWLQISKDYTW